MSEGFQENLIYEKLKVLEPIIGTWSAPWTDQQTGVEFEIQTTYRWVPTKRMIISDSVRRELKDGQPGEWTDSGPRHFYVWNDKLKSIQVYTFFTFGGLASTSRVLPKGNNEFEITHTEATVDLGTAISTMKISETEIISRSRDRRDIDGKVLDDVERVLKRVK